ncbi:MAG TPA: class I SAM-dependent methyltransferase [Blastocatellia bacterium]
MPNAGEDAARKEFNRWAAAGRGEGMIEGHIDVTEQIINDMDLRPSDRALDLGCGIGWATRMMAARVPRGIAVGVDLSDEMISRARTHDSNPSNIFFFASSAAALPFNTSYFNKLLSIESLYYYPDIPAALSEVYRVMAPAGRVFFMVNLYYENKGSRHWVEKLAIQAQLLSEEQYSRLFSEAGFQRVELRRVRDRRPMDDLLKPNSFDTHEQVRLGIEAGSLLIVAEK